MQDKTSNIKIFKALSDENRLKIIEHIQASSSQACKDTTCNPEDACISNLANSLGITSATTSHHVKELINAGIITTTKKGRWVYCRINNHVLSQVAVFLNQLGKETP